MKRKMNLPEGYYKDPACRRCKEIVCKKQLAKCKKEGFLVLCETCYTNMKASLEKCLPLMRKFSRR